MLSTRPSTTRSALPESIACDRAASYRRPAAIERSTAEEHHPGKGVGDHPEEEEEQMKYGLLEQLFSRFNPPQGRPEWWCPTNGNNGDPTQRLRLFRIELFAKKSRASWVSQEHLRFYLEPEPPGAIPIPLARLVVDGAKLRLEQAGGGNRPGALSSILIRVTPREPETEADSVPAREAAIIRRLPGSRGTLALTSYVPRLGVRLHDKLFVLPFPSSSVTLTFAGRWFYISHRWTEERLYSPIGLDYIDITSTLEKLIQVLYQMYWEDEREKKMVLDKEEQERRQREELFRRREELEGTCLELVDQVVHRRFELSLDTDWYVQCNFVEQEYPSELRPRVISDGRFVLPLTTSLLEELGFVEGYYSSDPETVSYTEQGDEAKGLRPVVMASMAPRSQGGHVLTLKFLEDRLKIRLDDGIVLQGWNGVSVDIRCDSDPFSSKLLTENQSRRILEWEADDDSPIPCAILLAQLSWKPLKMNESATVEEEKELGLECMFKVEAEEDEGAAYHPKKQHEGSRLDTSPPSGPPFEEEEEEEEEDCELSLLFGPPEEHDWVSMPEPYVPKFPTEEEIRERKERRKEQLKQVMEPITRPVSEPARGRNYFMDQPGTAVTHLLPNRVALFNYWTLSDKSESTWQPKSNVYPTLACLEWCNCSPSTMLQVYTLELIVADSLNSCKLDVSGFVAIRDFKDGKRNYIFNREMADPLTTVSHDGVLLLPTLSPRRAIGHTILLEFDLKMKRTCDGIDSYQQLIQGVSDHPTGGPYWSRVNKLSIRSVNSHSIPMVRVKLAMIMDGVEATIELRPLTLPSQGIDLRCAARTGRIGDDIVLFEGRYGGDDGPLQFVVAAELHGGMEIHLEGVYGGVTKRWSIGFEPKFHAVFSEAVDLSFAQVSLSVAWSQSSIQRTSGPPDL